MADLRVAITGTPSPISLSWPYDHGTWYIREPGRFNGYEVYRYADDGRAPKEPRYLVCTLTSQPAMSGAEKQSIATLIAAAPGLMRHALENATMNVEQIQNLNATVCRALLTKIARDAKALVERFD